jgi:ubiquinone/menaquinone biosynthesis C-methylase UbiE
MVIPQSELQSFSYKYWTGKTDGGHRHPSEEWYKKYAAEILAMFSTRGTLLDVGCGACQLTSYLAPEFEQVYAVDFSETMLATARQRIESRGLTNVRLLSGTAQKIPEVITSANVILSYQVLQYLTLADFSHHLHECRRVLSKGGMVCAAMIPNSALKDLYYHGRLIPNQVQFAGRMRRRIQLTRRPLVAIFQRDLLWDGIGNWFSQADIEGVANESGFGVEFRNSWFYEYRFHALLTLKQN